MRFAGLLAAIVFVAVLLNCALTPDSPWLQLQFVWGSPCVEIQSSGE